MHCRSDEPRSFEPTEMLRHGRLRHSGYSSQLARGEGLTAHQSSKRRRPRRVSDERSDFDEICGSDHCIIRCHVGGPDKHLEFGRGRTVVIIAHRISTIEHADKVIVLDAGKVVESGSVTQLLSEGGLFSRFYALHLRKTKVGRVPPGPPNQEARPDLVERKP